jgi:N-acetylmuramoyl-L-alanine amidase
MQPQPYLDLNELDIRALCMWREAQGEGSMGKRGVGWVIQNRIDSPGWWGHDAFTVVLCPEQFSSFNANDPNEDKWPSDDDHSWIDCQSFTQSIMSGKDTDVTNGATNYHDISIVDWPGGWGDESKYINTLNVGRFKFYRYSG